MRTIPNATPFAVTVATDSTTVWSRVTSAVTTAPVLRRPYARVADGSYRPEDLGLNGFDRLRWIHVGVCYKTRPQPFDVLLGRKPAKTESWEHAELAHAHINEREVCISDGRYLLSGPGVADGVLWHEYAHLVVGPFDSDHGPRWRDQMRAWDQQPVKYCPYVYGDAA